MSAREENDEALAEGEEREEAERLRKALEGDGEHVDLALVEALRNAWEPGDLSRECNDELIARAIGRADRAKGRVIRVSFAIAASLAAAAAVALVVIRGEWVESRPSAAPATLLRSRSTQDLFGDPFPQVGGTTARIDRITASRVRDFRANQFDRMGVR